MATTSSLDATLSMPRDENLRIELIEDPRQLTPEADDAFNREIARLAAIACGGPAQEDPRGAGGLAQLLHDPGRACARPRPDRARLGRRPPRRLQRHDGGAHGARRHA